MVGLAITLDFLQACTYVTIDVLNAHLHCIDFVETGKLVFSHINKFLRKQFWS